ncbi:hypothetical protein JANAI62_12300 [Jannaschia pagri]|uniref:Phospholipase/carboxylesterase/thioesterase domain-containing protein n=2 Tax=Roseobacteraceae TaxID=2854170 RepID=A0ABQ4NJP8_9RHOB|nr:hypothetical protein JANAI61_12330 [Jannaschia sp. AI_61]GIT94607.1 hypothetical protein JANAI62_12300 [Jannaschia sp. AI_62]
MRSLLAPLGLSDAALATPEAPGHSWWPTSFLAPTSEMEPHVEVGLSAIEAAVTGLDLPRSDIALIGFSQGACLALEYTARRGKGLGAAVGLSGGLVGTADGSGQIWGYPDKLFDYDTDLTGVPVLVTCHTQDPHIPLVRAEASARVLTALGAGAEMMIHPGPGHQPMPEGIAAARRMLGTA